VVVLDNAPLEELRSSSELRFVSRLNVTVTGDDVYVCQWSTAAGAADNLTSVVSVITGNAPALPIRTQRTPPYVHAFHVSSGVAIAGRACY